MVERPLTRGERAADRVAALVGSWLFIGIQSVIVVVWIAANTWLLTHPFDVFPYVLLNLAFSTQAAYAAPILQLSGNRQTRKIEDLAENTNAVVRKLLRNDELEEQLAVNDRHMLEAVLALLEAHSPEPPDSSDR